MSRLLAKCQKEEQFSLWVQLQRKRIKGKHMSMYERDRDNKKNTK